MGTVYLVGAGPWDEGLLTLRGRELLSRAGAVLYDALANPALLRHAPPGAERLFVGRRGGRGGPPMEEVCRQLVEAAGRHEVVVRLKGGDPFLFGRGGEEALGLRAAGVPFEVVPGVSSAVAAAAYAGIPLTHRGLASTVVYATGHPGEGGREVDFEAVGRLGGTLVLFMGISGFAEIAAALLRGGRGADTPVAFVRWGTRADQEAVTGRLGDYGAPGAAAPVRPPAIAVVGEVVDLRERLAWFDTRPLFGRRVVVTRPEAFEATGGGERPRGGGSEGEDDQGPQTLDAILRAAGAEIVSFPTIEILPPESWEACDAALREVERFDWIVLTSPRAVVALMERLAHLGRDVRALARARLAAVGESTAAWLADRGLRVDAVPLDARAEGVLEALRGKVAGTRVLLPRAGEGREVLPDGLRAAGAVEVAVVPVYRTAPARTDPAPLRAALEAGAIAAVTFTSGSSVKSFCDLLEAPPGGSPGDAARLCGRTRVAVIGAVTGKAALERGLVVDVQPARASIPELARAVVDALQKGTPA